MENIDNKLIKRDFVFVMLILAMLITLYKLNIGWFCPLNDGLGIPCPGCGFTSGTIALIKGRYTDAFYHHPLVFGTPIFLIFYPLFAYRKNSNKKYLRWFINIVIVIFIVVYILRIFGLIDGSATLKLNNNSIIQKIIN